MRKLLILFTVVCLLTGFNGCSMASKASKSVDNDAKSPQSNSQSGTKSFEENRDFKIEETKHFFLYFVEEDRECSKQVGEMLEKNYERIINDLGADINFKFHAKIYPNLNEFHKAAGIQNGEDWVAGKATSFKGFSMVSPNNPGPAHNYEDMLYVAVHEFTHCVVSNITNEIKDRWVVEGIAVYEADQSGRPDVNNLPSLSKLNEPTNNDIYMYGYHIFDFIDKTYGKEAVKSFIASGGNIEKTFHICAAEFEQKWKGYMKGRYSKTK